jgi:hypothetical protein
MRLLTVLVICGLIGWECAACNKISELTPQTVAPLVPSVSSTPSLVPTETNQPGPIESAPSNAATPITVRLLLSQPPKLNEQAKLTFIVSSVLDASETEATILLPEDAELIAGELTWRGPLVANQPQTLHATIRFTTEGDKTLQGKALYQLANGDVWGDSAYIYLNVSANSGYVGFATQEQLPLSSNDAPTPPSILPSPN